MISPCGILLLTMLAVSPATAGADRDACIQESAERYGIRRSLSATVFWAAERHDVPPDLFFAVVGQESDFRPGVVSPAGAVGLAQIRPSTARGLRSGLDRWQLFDPATNLDVGAEYLGRLLARYGGDRGRALAAYNVGPTRLARAERTGEPDGERYALQVLGRL